MSRGCRSIHRNQDKHGINTKQKDQGKGGGEDTMRINLRGMVLDSVKGPSP